MKYSIPQLQKELATRSPNEVLEIAAKLAKFRKENKDYLTYLLFGSADEQEYVKESKEKINESFATISRKSAYTTKKGLQKVIRVLYKLIKNSKSKQTEIELRIFFCNKVKSARINLDSSKVINNIYYREIEKIEAVYVKLHEDLRYDYKPDMERLGIESI